MKYKTGLAFQPGEHDRGVRFSIGDDNDSVAHPRSNSFSTPTQIRVIHKA
jgi:hypothetical protein